MASLVQQETPCGVASAIWNIITSAQGEEIEQSKLVEQLADVLEDTGKHHDKKHPSNPVFLH